MVLYAIEELDSAFTIRHLARAFGTTHYQIRKLAERWERQGLLAPSENTAGGRTGRQVTGQLLEMA